jgi:1-acyl-sn-glycerol-3-phosphate acyltransferase
LENINFDDIRPFHDSEVSAVLEKLAKDNSFIEMVKKIYPHAQAEAYLVNLKSIHSVFDFQSVYISGYVNKIIQKTVTSFTYSGLENLNPRKKYLFISNHRDIILDSAFLNIILFESKFPTTQIAIGSNLLIYPWIMDLVRLNKSFIVKRGLGGKEMLEASQQLSAYIRKTLTNNESSIWIAQKEGRTKDGNDKTHIGLLKMFNYSGSNHFADDFKELNIVPISISYEFEPCDISKTKEIYTVHSGEKYEKTPGDDLKSMAGGVNAPKGRVHFEFCKPIDEELYDTGDIKNVNERFEALTQSIDRRIYKGYKLNEINYIAADLLANDNRYQNLYSAESKQKTEGYFEKRISEIAGEKAEIRKIFLEIYANPVKNKIENE